MSGITIDDGKFAVISGRRGSYKTVVSVAIAAERLKVGDDCTVFSQYPVRFASPFASLLAIEGLKSGDLVLLQEDLLSLDDQINLRKSLTTWKEAGVSAILETQRPVWPEDELALHPVLSRMDYWLETEAVGPGSADLKVWHDPLRAAPDPGHPFGPPALAVRLEGLERLYGLYGDVQVIWGRRGQGKLPPGMLRAMLDATDDEEEA